MTLDVSHGFVSTVGDLGDPNVVGPNEWNAQHSFKAAGPCILGVPAASAAAAVSEIPPLLSGQVLTWNGTNITWSAALGAFSFTSLSINPTGAGPFPILAGGTTPTFQVSGPTAAASTISALRHSNDFNPARMHMGKSRNATPGSHTVVSSGDVLGEIVFEGSDGTAFQNAAFIRGISDGTPGANDMPGRLQFMTSQDGLTVPIEAMRIDSSQRVMISGSVSQFNT